jgi:hypothetical protein
LRQVRHRGGCFGKLNRDAVDAAAVKAGYQAELALALESQGNFFLATGQVTSAEDPLREALAIRQQLFEGGRLGRSEDRYLVRVYANLGRVLAAAGQTAEAERSYREAAKLLGRVEGWRGTPKARSIRYSPFPLGVPHTPGREPVSSPRHVERSRRFSRTPLSCPLHPKG